MNNEFLDEQPIILSQILQRAYQIYRNSFQIFISISLIYGILSELGGMMLKTLELSPQETAFYNSIVNILLACWASVALIYSSSRIYHKKTITLNEAFAVAKRKYWAYVAIYISLLAVMGVGFMMLIIPGLYFTTVFIFADLLVVLENAKFNNAFRISARMVKNYFWKVFTYLMIIVCISIIPELCQQVLLSFNPKLAAGIHKAVSVLIMPYLMIAQVGLYYQIKKRVDQREEVFGEGNEFV